MLDVIDLFREQETRDELGIGTVRDAFADAFFPGTSTIQTRARYFFFVPWVYRDLEHRRVPSDKARDRARKGEVATIFALLKSNDTSGLLGKQAKEALQRLPSSVYWQGLRVWGVCLFPGSLDQYHRSLDGYYRRADRADAELPAAPNWHAGLPGAPEGFPENITFRLTPGEAQYLRDRVLARVPKSLLAFLVDSDGAEAEVDFPWAHPLSKEFPPPLQELLAHARNFSEAIHGAAYLYNLMLAEKKPADDLVEKYAKLLNEWHEQLEARGAALRDWDRTQFWQLVVGAGARVSPQTRMFIDGWLGLALDGDGKKSTGGAARQLVATRERALKRGLSRLDNQRALELWNGAAGTGALDFRWGPTRVILRDIRQGLCEEE
ncbi:hypothetical protein GobsT_25330 [Gemmata obscuriglobus]|nr:hypothetical protein GobsT_25330 [Gemmata obscuriglobus]VTS05064.1 Uncharacterized protein OS=Cyanothece sp. (strain PCC 7425 / ATCC 29141) GN=Cyan7425_0145 PE=4 SV=1 [Gemmata obscuriglobus UQM 2246]